MRAHIVRYSPKLIMPKNCLKWEGFARGPDVGSDRQKVDLLVDELTSLLRSVNGLLGSQSLEVSRSTLDSRLNYTSKRIGEVLPGCELSPMRMVLFLEFCAHLNMGLFQTKKIRNLLEYAGYSGSPKTKI